MKKISQIFFLRITLPPIHFQKTFAALLGHMSPQLRGVWFAHEQTVQISREELPQPRKQRQNELEKLKFFVSLPFWRRLFFFWSPVLKDGGQLRLDLFRIFLIHSFLLSTFHIAHLFVAFFY